MVREMKFFPHCRMFKTVGKKSTSKLSRDTIEILEYRKSGGEKRLFLNYDSKATESLTPSTATF